MVRRNTIQRSLVLEAVNTLRCHATADEVYEAIAREHPNISRGTVYRNLNQLSEQGEIRRIQVLGGADRYDHQSHDHYHVKCLRCGRIFDVEMEYLSGLEKNAKAPQGFAVTGHEIMFQGICPQCGK